MQIPVPPFRKIAFEPVVKKSAGVAEWADARDLKSLDPLGSCRFDSGLRHLKRIIGPLAQLVEHLVFNPVAAGSSPARPITIFRRLDGLIHEGKPGLEFRPAIVRQQNR